MATKKIKVIRQVERKTFVKGNFVGKYHGDFDDRNSFLTNAKYYDIHVYEGEIKNVQTVQEEVFDNIESEIHFLQSQFENVISITDEKVVDYDAFRLKIKDPKVESIIIKDVTKEDKQTFGTFTCIVYGYLLDFIDKEEEIDVQVCESCNDSTGNCICKPTVPIKPAVNVDEDEEVEEEPNLPPTLTSWSWDGCYEALGWIMLTGFGLMFLAALGLPGIAIIVCLAIIYFFFKYFSALASVVLHIFSWLSRIAFGLLVGFFLFSIVSGIYSRLTDTSTKQSIKPKVVQHPSEENVKRFEINDSLTLISHKRIWQDYEKHVYTGSLKVLESDYKLSTQYRNSIDFSLYNDYQWSLFYSSLIENDKNKLKYVFSTFDSIGNANQLDKKQFAEMIVSCVQDIPYALVVQNECNKDLYGEAFIKEQLELCQECCIGDIKYGVQAPAEFTANLKGDCDTRTVILFTILSKYGYDVAVLGSLSYQHSILAINLPYSGTYKEVNGKKYYVWETTATGFEPGILNPKLSNMELWNTHLITNNN